MNLEEFNKVGERVRGRITKMKSIRREMNILKDCLNNSGFESNIMINFTNNDRDKSLLQSYCPKLKQDMMTIMEDQVKRFELEIRELEATNYNTIRRL